MKAIILAGGSGTRLWPLSRKSYPKQFLQLGGEESLLKQAIERVSNAVATEDIIVITSEEYKFYVNFDFGNINHVILEPMGKNTAPAIALGVKYCLDKLRCTEDEVVFICPSDHVVKPAKKFAASLEAAEVIAKEGNLVTFGVIPTRPETGYGYIKVNGECMSATGHRYLRVEQFIEKPDMETAKQYMGDKRYYWNAGMFAFTAGTMLEELGKFAPGIRKLLDGSYDEVLSNFREMPEISIDYAVMEKSRKVVTVPMDIYWNDIGSWDSVFEMLKKDKQGNAFDGDVVAVDTTGTMVIGKKRLIATVGLHDCLVVETDDAVLIAQKGDTQKLKEVVKRLNGRKEVTEHLTVYRPWGSYTLLEKGPSYKIKKVVVKPQQKLSLQMHYHRSEHWVVVSGMAKVTIGDEEKLVHINESIYVPKGTYHRLENPGEISLEIIEVQNGEYLEEDDIVRFEDSYGRD